MSDTKQVPGTATMAAAAAAAIQTTLGAASAIRGGLRALGRRWRERRTVASLDALDDATLKDIGVCRCEIPAIARASSPARGGPGRHCLENLADSFCIFAPGLHGHDENEPWSGPESHASAGRMTSSG